MDEHILEAASMRVPGTIAHRDELWDRCYADLMANVTTRLEQEVSRLGGNYVHVLAEVCGQQTQRCDQRSVAAWRLPLSPLPETGKSLTAGIHERTLREGCYNRCFMAQRKKKVRARAVARAQLPTGFGRFTIFGIEGGPGEEAVAIVHGRTFRESARWCACIRNASPEMCSHRSGAIAGRSWNSPCARLPKSHLESCSTSRRRAAASA